MSALEDEIVRRIHTDSLTRRQAYPACPSCVLPSAHSVPHGWHGLACPKCGCPSSYTTEGGRP